MTHTKDRLIRRAENRAKKKFTIVKVHYKGVHYRRLLLYIFIADTHLGNLKESIHLVTRIIVFQLMGRKLH